MRGEKGGGGAMRRHTFKLNCVAPRRSGEQFKQFYRYCECNTFDAFTCCVVTRFTLASRTKKHNQPTRAMPPLLH